MTWRISSGVQALMVGFVSPIVLIVLGDLFGTPGRNFSPGENVAFALYALLVAGACFVICRRHPRSGWYVPFICNTAGIVAACIEPNFWRTRMWIPFVAVWILSAAATLAGICLGRSRRPP
jgi:hypothetical protein